MNFAYIAGFFDGEGCVHAQPNIQAHRITIVQSAPQDAVLHRIKEFLEPLGVKASVRTTRHPYVGRNGLRASMTTLAVCNSASLIVFLSGIMPYLVVKKAKAEQALSNAIEVQKRKDEAKRLNDRYREAYERQRQVVTKGPKPQPFCKNGHEFTPSNTYFVKYGTQINRSCRQCRAIWQRNSKNRQRVISSLGV